jgi:hypothetical protein
MRKSDLPNCPQWLLDADTYCADVAWNSDQHNHVIWRDGAFRGGEFFAGEFRGGEFCGGVFRDGVFSGGEFSGGEFRDGVFRGGVFRGDVFRGGEFSGGEWRAPENRLLYMAAMLGIVFDSDGYATAYRSTHADGRGRYSHQFIQPEGDFFEPNCAPTGSGTCGPGIHVSSAAIAYTYFGINRSAQLWSVKFHRDDLLDCDGQKARIRGGHFEKIPWPFLPEGAK